MVERAADHRFGGLVDQGQFKLAYSIVSKYAAATPADIVEAEFHSGWYAIARLEGSSDGAGCFRRILDVSSGPISVSRAWYWMGRSAEAGGGGKAAGFYAKAANCSATFYGQLAGEKLGRKAINVSYPSPSSADRERYQQREAVQAIARLDAAGHGWRANALYLALGEQMQSPGELAILAAQAERTGNHQLSLQIGKSAYARGIDVAALAFPIGVIPGTASISGSGKALACRSPGRKAPSTRPRFRRPTRAACCRSCREPPRPSRSAPASPTPGQAHHGRRLQCNAARIISASRSTRSAAPTS